MPRVFAYGRASTDRQQITLSSQESITSKWFHLKQLQQSEDSEDKYVWAGWFPDAAVTSTIDLFQRPQGQKLFMALTRGDIFLVSNFDRAFRSVRDCDNVMRISNERGFAMVILDVDVNTSTPLGKAFMKIIAVLKELEREEIVRRTREALSECYATSTAIGKLVPIGYRIANENTKEFVPDELVRKQCEQIRTWMNKNKWSLARVKREIDILGWEVPLKDAGHTSWHLHLITNCYVSATCNYPKVFRKDMPRLRQLRDYQKAHGGRSPQLEPYALRAGLLHTLPPIPHPHEVAGQRKRQQYREQWA